MNLLASIGVGDEQEEDVVNARAGALKDVFVRSGGFTSLLDIVLTSGTPSDTTVDEASFVRRTTLCTALHVMHFLLLGALDVDVDVSVDAFREGPPLGSDVDVDIDIDVVSVLRVVLQFVSFVDVD